MFMTSKNHKIWDKHYEMIVRFIHLYIYYACLLPCLSFCIETGPNFFGTSRDPREGLWIMKISKKFVKFWKFADKFYDIRKLFCFCFILYKEKMSIIKLEDWRIKLVLLTRALPLNQKFFNFCNSFV